MATTSLLNLIEQLLGDGDAAAQFRSSPDGFLAEHGLDDFSGADIVDALSLGFDSIAPDLAMRIVLPAVDSVASAVDALTSVLDAAPDTSVLDDAADATDLDFGFGIGDVSEPAERAFDVDDLELDLDFTLDPIDAGADDDLDTATFDQGFGDGSHGLDVDDLHDVDDLGFGLDPHGDDDGDFGHG